MAKVGAELGLTLKLYKDEKTYEFIRPDLEIRDIKVKTEGTVEDQLEASVVALRKVYEAVCNEMQKVLDKQFNQIEKEIKASK